MVKQMKKKKKDEQQQQHKYEREFLYYEDYDLNKMLYRI